MQDKLNNVVNLREDKVKASIQRSLEFAAKQVDSLNIVNCVVIMVDDDDIVTYSYSNTNREVTMIGAIEFLKRIFMKACDEE